MRSLLSAVIAVTLTAVCIAAEEEPTIEQVAKNPAKFEGKTLVFKGVEVSGKVVDGPKQTRLTVKTKDGKEIDSKLTKDGITFVIPKEKAPEMTKELKEDKFYPATLTCKIEKGGKDHWLAVVQQVDFPDNTVKAAEERVKAAETRADLSDKKAKAAEEKADLADKKVKATEERAKAAEEKSKTANESAKAAEVKADLAEKKVKAAEEKAGLADKKVTAAEAKATAAEEKAQVSDKSAKAAEEKARTAEARVRAAETKADLADKKAKAIEERATAAEEKARAANESAKAAELRADLSDKKARAAEEKAGLADKKVTVAESRATAAEEKAQVSDKSAKAAETKADLDNKKAKAAEEKADLADKKIKATEERAKAAEEKAQVSDKSAKAADTKADLADKKARATEEKVELADKKVKAAEEKARTAEEKAKAAETRADLADKKAKAAEGKAELPDGRIKAAEERAKTAEEKADQFSTKVKAVEEKARTAEEKAKAAEMRADLADKKARAAEEKADLAESKVKAAEERAKTAEEKAQVSNKTSKAADEKVNDKPPADKATEQVGLDSTTVGNDTPRRPYAALLAIPLLFCVSVGLLLVWKHPRWGRKITALVGFLGAMAVKRKNPKGNDEATTSGFCQNESLAQTLAETSVHPLPHKAQPDESTAQPLAEHPAVSPQTQTASGAHKECPFCAEEIPSEEVVCRFCQRDLAAGEPIPAEALASVVSKEVVSVPQQPGRGSGRRRLIQAITTIVLIFGGWSVYKAGMFVPSSKSAGGVPVAPDTALAKASTEKNRIGNVVKAEPPMKEPQPKEKDHPRPESKDEPPLPKKPVEETIFTRLEGHTGKVTTIRFSPDGSALAAVGEDNSVRVWDVATTKSRFVLAKPEKGTAYSDLAFSEDGKKVVVARARIEPKSKGPAGYSIEVYDLLTGKQEERYNDAEHGFSNIAYLQKDRAVIVAGQGIQVWDSASFKEKGQPASQFGEDGLWMLSPDAKHAGSWTMIDAQQGGKVVVSVHDLESHKLVETEPVAYEKRDGLFVSAFVHNMAFSRDGSRFAYDCIWSAFPPIERPNTITFWDMEKKVKRTASFPEGASGVGGIWFSPNGSLAATITRLQRKGTTQANSSQVQLWDATNGKLLRTFPGELPITSPETRGSACFSPDGKYLLVRDRTVARYHDVSTGEVAKTQYSETIATCSIFTFSSDGRFLAGADDRGVVRLQELSQGEEPKPNKSVDSNQPATKAAEVSAPLTLQGHTDSVNCVAFSPDGKRMVSGGYDKTVKVWDAVTGQEVFSLKGHDARVNSVAFTPDSKRIVSGSSDRTVKVWDTAIAQEVLSLKHANMVNSVAFSPDGKRIVSGAGSIDAKVGWIKVWDAATGKELFSLTVRSMVNSVAFSPDGKRIVSGVSDVYAGEVPINVADEVTVWDVATSKEVFSLRHGDTVKSVAFSPDGKRIVSGGVDKTVKVWDADSGKEVLTLKGHTNRVECVAFSPDGKRIVSGGVDKTARLWDVTTGQQTLALKWRLGHVQGVAFSPDGKRLAIALWDKTVRVWGVTDRETPAKDCKILDFKGNKLYYSATVTESEAKQLGDFLLKINYYKSGGSTINQLDKKGGTYEFRVSISVLSIKSEKVLAASKQLANVLSKEVFNGEFVEVHLCTDIQNSFKSSNLVESDD